MNAVATTAPARRIVSLLPSATEWVCLLGASARIVGRSHACDFPIEITSLPVCTRTTLVADATSRELDSAVRARAQAARSLYQLDVPLLRALQPDLILTQAQCAVCAISEADLTAALADWSGPPPRVLALAPQRFADLWTDLRQVAAALGLAEPARELERALKHRCVDVIERACLLARPSVACLEWLDPLMGAGNWIPEMVELAGGKNLFGVAGQHSDALAFEQLRAANPDVLIALPCGFDLARTRREFAELLRQPGWAELKAVRAGRVFACDGSAYFNRPGPRLVDSLEIVAELLHPAKFKFGHAQRGWSQPAA